MLTFHAKSSRWQAGEPFRNVCAIEYVIVEMRVEEYKMYWLGNEAVSLWALVGIKMLKI